MKKALAIFDFDGTISNNDSLKDYLRFCEGGWNFFLKYYLLFTFDLIKCLFNKNLFLKLKTNRMKLFFRNKNVDFLLLKADEYYKSKFKNILKSSAIKRLEWHRSMNHEIVILSASLDIILEKWCEENDFYLITNKLQIKENKFTGNLIELDCNGEQKVVKLLEKFNLNDYDETYGYGDTKGDLDFLELVDKKYYQYFK
tara:strand:- start:20777 stop:21373 length:597 start_codon:yes stop_codon:yes gene_type:complete